MVSVKQIYIHNIDDYIVVDDEDFDRINQYHWYLDTSYASPRVLTNINRKKIALPYFITRKFNAYQKDKNLDFRKSNIGIDEHKYRYRKPQKNATSKFKGVRLMKMNSGNYTWISSISTGYKRIHLGSFETEIEAAKAYNHAVKEYWNGNGYMNDIHGEAEE